MKWIEKFIESIDHFAGESIRKKVMSTGEKLRLKTSSRKAEWISGIMKKLEASTDEETLKKIMIATCPHKFPKGRIQQLKRKYKKLGDIDKLLVIMRNDHSWKGTSYYDHPIRKGNIIYMTKIPYDPNAHNNANTDKEKHLAYCHCPWIKAAIVEKKEVPPIFCYCASAWDKQLWEGILEKEIKTELISCLLKGDDRCIHAFHLHAEKI